jgi:hypothetical protein
MAKSDYDREIRDRVEKFVADMTILIRRAALESVGEALKGRASKRPVPAIPKGATRGSSSSTGRGRRVAERAVAGGGRKKRAAKGAKRSPESLETLSNDLLARIKKNPGERIEEIAEALGTTTKELTLPARKLVEGRKVKTRGQKRATRYFAK